MLDSVQMHEMTVIGLNVLNGDSHQNIYFEDASWAAHYSESENRVNM